MRKNNNTSGMQKIIIIFSGLTNQIIDRFFTSILTINPLILKEKLEEYKAEYDRVESDAINYQKEYLIRKFSKNMTKLGLNELIRKGIN